MAKERKTNSGEAAFGSLLQVIGTVAKVELKDNPEALAKVDKMVADVKDSNLVTGIKLQDDAINAMHDADDAAEAAAADQQAAELED